MEELEPSIRYCLHKVGKSSLQTSELLEVGEMEGPALDLFKAKLEVSFIPSQNKLCWQVKLLIIYFLMIIVALLPVFNDYSFRKFK